MRDLYARSAGIQRVLHQFLDHGGGPLDHLARRDAIHHGSIKYAYLLHERILPDLLELAALGRSATAS